MPLASVTSIPFGGLATTVPDTASVLIWAVASRSTSKVLDEPAIALDVVEATTAGLEEVALVAAQALACLSASAAAWKAVSLVLIAL